VWRVPASSLRPQDRKRSCVIHALRRKVGAVVANTSPTAAADVTPKKSKRAREGEGDAGEAGVKESKESKTQRKEEKKKRKLAEAE
jgi:hypothetical protein